MRGTATISVQTGVSRSGGALDLAGIVQSITDLAGNYCKQSAPSVTQPWGRGEGADPRDFLMRRIGSGLFPRFLSIHLPS